MLSNLKVAYLILDIKILEVAYTVFIWLQMEFFPLFSSFKWLSELSYCTKRLHSLLSNSWSSPIKQNIYS